MNQLINFIVFFFFLYKYEISSISINNKFISVPRKRAHTVKGRPISGAPNRRHTSLMRVFMTCHV